MKVRLGLVNAFGEQKGVDSLIVTDLINLSRNRAMSDAVLLTGDEDICVGVQQAQETGVRVHLIGLADSQTNQSRLLRQEADTLREISKAEVQGFLTQVAPAVIAPPVTPATGLNPILAAAQQVADLLTKPDLERVANDTRGHVPPDIDRQLLKTGAATLKATLSETQKRDLRKAFVAACKTGQSKQL